MIISNIVSLPIERISLACVLIMILALTTWRADLRLARPLLIASLRLIIQLSLVGLILEYVFEINNFLLVTLIALVMLLVACSMFVSSFAVSIFGLAAIIRAESWWDPRYSIPVLGMLLGNTMTAVALSLDRFTTYVWEGRETIEAKLMLGHSSQEALKMISRDSLRAGLMPVINSMAIAGIVSLPGMMTGQILAGNSPTDAVRYQIVIWLLIAVGCGFGSMLVVQMASKRVFDERERLRTERIYKV